MKIVTGACTTKRFMTVIVAVIATAIHFYPSLIFTDMTRKLPGEWSPLKAPLLQSPALPANNRLGSMANTLAYYNLARITIVQFL